MKKVEPVVGGRITLINSFLTSMPLNMASLFPIPKGVIKRLDFYRSRFLWREEQGLKKYHLTKWEVWTWKNLITACLVNGWLDYIMGKVCGRHYSQENNWVIVPFPKSLIRWEILTSGLGLWKSNTYFYPHCAVKIWNGEQTSFWEDSWLGNTPLIPHVITDP